VGCPWGEAVARGGSVMGPYRLGRRQFERIILVGARKGLYECGVDHDDVEVFAEAVRRRVLEELESEEG
jgi:hypothetical protein